MKKTLPELKPALNQTPGYGLLTLQGWETPEASFDYNYEVCVQRNQDSRFLGADNQWTATQTWHQVDASESQNEFVALTLGPNIVDPLVENPQMTYLLQARYGTELAQGVMRIREGVLSSHALGQTGEAVSRVAKPVQAVPPAAATETATPEHSPVAAQTAVADSADQPKSKSSQTLLIVAVVLILLLIAAYFGWRWYQGQQATPVATTAPSSTSAPDAVTTPPAAAPTTTAPVTTVAPTQAPVSAAPPAPQEPAPCSSEALSATKDDLPFIQTCLKTNPDTAKVLAVIELAKTAKRCDVAQRIYAFKGQGGDVVIALAYAKEFDPKFFVAGCFAAADKNTAVYWYELVLARDPNHTEAKERAEALKK